MLDPELREYAKYLTMEYLRQVYYDKGSDWGFGMENILWNIKDMIKRKNGVSDEIFDKVGLDYTILSSALNELIADGHATFHTGQPNIFSPQIYYYKLTKDGINYIKGLREPPKPAQFTLISGNSGSTIIAGNKNKLK